MRRAAAHVHAYLRRDTAFVLTMVMAMTLSTFALYQSTVAGDASDALHSSALSLDTEATRLSGATQTLIASDAQALQRRCAADLKYADAVANLLSLDPTDVQTLIASTVQREALAPLVRGDRGAQCDGVSPAYSVQKAVQVAQPDGRTASVLTASAQQARAEAVAFGVQERALVALALLFIIALALLVVADQLRDRRGRPGWVRGGSAKRWRVLLAVACGGVLVVGAAFLFAFAVNRVLIGAVLFVLMAAAVAERAWSRRARAATSGSDPSLRWWAEVLGAAALVVFAAATIVFATVSIEEREAAAQAQALTTEAGRAQAHAEQQILRELAALTTYAHAEAEAIAAAQMAVIAPDGPTGQGSQGQRDELAARLLSLEESLREQIVGGPVGTEDDACAWFVQEPPVSMADLYLDLATSEGVQWHAWAQQEATFACDAAVALTRAKITVWAEHGSRLTVALLVLGLSVFMFGLASGPNRSRSAARLLLGVGAAGTLVGIGLTVSVLPDAVWRQGVLSDDDVRVVSRAVAAGQVRPCEEEVIADLRAAVARAPWFGRAQEVFGYAVWGCLASNPKQGMQTAETDARRTSEALSALLRASELAPGTPSLEGNVGWALIEFGLHGPYPEAVSAGLTRTEESLAALGELDADHAHVLRMNRAFALAALDRHDEALAAYREAGDRLDDGEIGQRTRVGALADLELLETVVAADRLDEYRRAVVGPTGGVAPASASPKLSVFPQELQVSGDPGMVGQPASIVWYYREGPGEVWAVVTQATLRTLRAGSHVGWPVPAGMLLPSGHYRADVYLGDEVIRLSVEDHRALEGHALYESRRLGVSAVVPEEWLLWIDDGVDWHLGPTQDSGIRIRRIEFRDLGWDSAASLSEDLLEWAGDAFAVDSSTTEVSDIDWFLGARAPVVRDLPEHGVRAAAGPLLWGSGEGCGATVLMAAAGGDAIGPASWRLLSEIVLTRLPPTIPAGGWFESEVIALWVPPEWNATLRHQSTPGHLLFAKDCTTLAANVIVNWNDEADIVDIDAYADELLAYYAAEFPEYELAERSAISVSGADAAVQIDFGWTPGAGRVTQRQVFATRAGGLLTMTLSVPSGWEARYADVLEKIVASLELR